MTYRPILVSSTAVAAAIAVALILRPSRTIGPEMAAPTGIPPAMRAIVSKRMQRHSGQIGELMSRLIVLDYEGAARAAGAVHDEPTLARPMMPDELNQLLPDRFFTLQDQFKAQARRVVVAAAQRDNGRLAEEFGALTKTCVECHSAYLYERPAVRPPN